MRALSLLLLLPAVGCTGDTGSHTGSDTGDTGSDTGDTGEPVSPRIAWHPTVAPVDLTPDGGTALLQDPTSLDGLLLLLDTESGEQRAATTLGDATRNQATGLSAGEHISALHGVPVQAGLWSASTGWTDLASPFAQGCDTDIGGAFDVNDAGDVVVGLMWDGCVPAAFRWSASDGMQVLDILGEAYDGSSSPPVNRASVVSGDGLVAAGFATLNPVDRSPARWTADGAGELLTPDDRATPGEVLSIDGDGDTLGVLRGYDGFLWTVDGGFTPLGRPEAALPTDPVYPLALTADGGALFGGVGSEYMTVPIAFVWTAAAGMRPLAELVAEAGVVVEEGWILTSVVAVSDDGSVLLGRGFDTEFAPYTFVLHVPATTWGP